MYLFVVVCVEGGFSQIQSQLRYLLAYESNTITLNFCTCNICIHAYHILLVNSLGYYKLQVEIGAAANQNFVMKLCIRYKFNIVLRGD